MGVVYVSGNPTPRKQYTPFQWGCGIMLGIFAAIALVNLIVFVVIPLIIAAGAAASKPTNSNSAPASTAPTVPPPIVTLSDYNQFTTSVNYSEVVNAIGKEGRRIEAPEGGNAFQWDNADGSYMRLTFKYGRLWKKAQSGLQ
jgi:hypothetical protein